MLQDEFPLELFRAFQKKKGVSIAKRCIINFSCLVNEMQK